MIETNLPIPCISKGSVTNPAFLNTISTANIGKDFSWTYHISIPRGEIIFFISGAPKTDFAESITKKNVKNKRLNPI